ncbi:MAG: type III secretion system chaperone [Gemmataceae bacterium]
MKKISIMLILGAALLALPALRPEGVNAGKAGQSPSGATVAPVDDLARGVALDALTDESLSTMLRELGYEPTVRKNTSGSGSVYHLKVPRGTWTFEVDVSLSNNKRKVWLSCWFNDMARDPTASEFSALMEANFKHGPAHFTYTPKTRTLNLGMALDNRALSNDILRLELDTFMDVIRDTQSLWNLR